MPQAKWCRFCLFVLFVCLFVCLVLWLAAKAKDPKLTSLCWATTRPELGWMVVQDTLLSRGAIWQAWLVCGSLDQQSGISKEMVPVPVRPECRLEFDLGTIEDIYWHFLSTYIPGPMWPAHRAICDWLLRWFQSRWLLNARFNMECA